MTVRILTHFDSENPSPYKRPRGETAGDGVWGQGWMTGESRNHR